MQVTISKDRLDEIIDESINEVIEEMMTDEGIGHALGRARQWLRNKWNNFKGDYEAGKRYERDRNMEYDPYAQYGDDADRIRSLDSRTYAKSRYDLTVDRNRRARQQYHPDSPMDRGDMAPSNDGNGNNGYEGDGQYDPDSSEPQPLPQI